MTDSNKEISNKLEDIAKLLKQSMAIQLFDLGIPKDKIRNNLKMDENEVYAVLKGAKKGN